MFALIALFMLVVDWLSGGWSTSQYFCVYGSSPLDPAFYIRLFGHSLGHADLSHYVSNMMVILLVGPLVEERYGSKRLALMMAATSAIIGGAHLLFSNAALLGASGIAFILIVLASLVPGEDGTVPVT